MNNNVRETLIYITLRTLNKYRAHWKVAPLQMVKKRQISTVPLGSNLIYFLWAFRHLKKKLTRLISPQVSLDILPVCVKIFSPLANLANPLEKTGNWLTAIFCAEHHHFHYRKPHCLEIIVRFCPQQKSAFNPAVPGVEFCLEPNSQVFLILVKICVFASANSWN